MENTNDTDGLEIERSDLSELAKKLKTIWTPYSEEEKKLVMDAISMKGSMDNYFHHGYSDDQPVMGFFNWEGADFERVKREYPDSMTTEEKDAVLEYMRNATEEASYMGDATSRIEGDKVFVGYKDMRTPDGKWIFPHNWDTHYVEKYDISPPREFVEDAIKWSKINHE